MKIFMFDIDGTVVPKGKSYPVKSFYEAVDLVHSNGDLMMVNTGRCMYMIKDTMAKLFDAIILGNGSHIIKNGKLIYNTYLAEETTRAILTYCHNHGVSIGVNKFEGLEIVGDFDKACKYEYVFEDTTIRYCIPSSFETIRMDDSYCMYAYLEEGEDIAGFKKAVREAGVECYDSSLDCCYDVVDPKVGKENGVKIIREMYPGSEIIGFGDGHNDVNFLSVCDISYAMGNSDTIVKEKADYVIGDCTTDAIYQAIKKIYDK